VDVTFKVSAAVSTEKLQSLAYRAVASSPADAYLRNAVDSIFTLNKNGSQIPVGRVSASSSHQTHDPSQLYGMVKPEFPNSAAVDTHVFIGTEEGDEATQKLLHMGEQTCYLHAACRSALKTRVRALAL